MKKKLLRERNAEVKEEVKEEIKEVKEVKKVRRNVKSSK